MLQLHKINRSIAVVVITGSVFLSSTAAAERKWVVVENFNNTAVAAYGTNKARVGRVHVKNTQDVTASLPTGTAAASVENGRLTFRPISLVYEETPITQMIIPAGLTKGTFGLRMQVQYKDCALPQGEFLSTGFATHLTTGDTNSGPNRRGVYSHFSLAKSVDQQNAFGTFYARVRTGTNRELAQSKNPETFVEEALPRGPFSLALYYDRRNVTLASSAFGTIRHNVVTPIGEYSDGKTPITISVYDMFGSTDLIPNCRLLIDNISLLKDV